METKGVAGTPVPSILVVDDEPTVCWALKRLLRMHGYAVCVAHSGAEALESVAQRRFTHILLDAKLGDMDGLVLAAEVRGRAPLAAVFLISAYFYSDDPKIVRALEQGLIHGFIPKPFTHGEVLRCLTDPWKSLDYIP